MAYFVSPTWRYILVKAREEYGDKVIHYLLSYNTELSKQYDWDYFKTIFQYLPPRGGSKDYRVNSYWEYINSKKVINNPTLLKQTEDLIVEFPNKLKREISLYDFVFVICFFKLIYDDKGHFSFGSTKSELEVKNLKDDLIDLVEDEFAKEDINYIHNSPYCNIDMMKPLIKGCLGYSIGSDDRDHWTWVDNQFDNAGINVSELQGKLWFERFWDSKDFRIKLMNWKRLPF
jgi:hypothetical protein